MRLPHLSPENKDLILCFAAAATKHSGDVNDRIARSGPLSIFAAFSACVPGVLRGAAGFTKSGVAETAFNHALEKDAGFSRERDRRTVAVGKKKDPLQVGMYLLTKHRWLDPNEPADNARLVEGFSQPQAGNGVATPAAVQRPRIEEGDRSSGLAKRKRSELDLKLGILDRLQKEGAGIGQLQGQKARLHGGMDMEQGLHQQLYNLQAQQQLAQFSGDPSQQHQATLLAMGGSQLQGQGNMRLMQDLRNLPGMTGNVVFPSQTGEQHQDSFEPGGGGNTGGGGGGEVDASIQWPGGNPYVAGDSWLSEQAWDPHGRNARGGQMLSTFGNDPLNRQWGGAGGKGPTANLTGAPVQHWSTMGAGGGMGGMMTSGNGGGGALGAGISAGTANLQTAGGMSNFPQMYMLAAQGGLSGGMSGGFPGQVPLPVGQQNLGGMHMGQVFASQIPGFGQLQPMQQGMLQGQQGMLPSSGQQGMGPLGQAGMLSNLTNPSRGLPPGYGALGTAQSLNVSSLAGVAANPSDAVGNVGGVASVTAAGQGQGGVGGVGGVGG
ncbi:hypothetical protein T484DRAFT_1885766, partial [Baffinella frigidus]